MELLTLELSDFQKISPLKAKVLRGGVISGVQCTLAYHFRKWPEITVDPKLLERAVFCCLDSNHWLPAIVVVVVLLWQLFGL